MTCESPAKYVAFGFAKSDTFNFVHTVYMYIFQGRAAVPAQPQIDCERAQPMNRGNRVDISIPIRSVFSVFARTIRRPPEGWEFSALASPGALGQSYSNSGRS